MGVGGKKGILGWVGRIAPSETPEATHFEEGLALLANVSHCEVGAGITHDEGEFGQKAIPEQPPEGRVWLWPGQGGQGRRGGQGAMGRYLPDGGVDLLLGQVALWQREQAWLGEGGDTT